MAQIAAAAGVSQPTVSLVLNGMADSMRIKESTRHKVLETAKQLGYQRVTPNSLQGKRRIAFVLDGAIITNDHFITALNEANVRANELGLVLCQLDTAGNERGRELVKKELYSAQLYYNLGTYFGNCTSGGSNYEACIITAQNAINDYPYTSLREDFALLIMKSKFELAEQSVEEKKIDRYRDAEDECYGFINEYPESKNKKLAEKYIASCKKYTKEK